MSRVPRRELEAERRAEQKSVWYQYLRRWDHAQDASTSARTETSLPERHNEVYRRRRQAKELTGVWVLEGNNKLSRAVVPRALSLLEPAARGPSSPRPLSSRRPSDREGIALMLQPRTRLSPWALGCPSHTNTSSWSPSDIPSRRL